MRFVIPFRLPSLNDYINKCRTNKYEAASFKNRIENSIITELMLQRVPKIAKPCRLHFTWHEKNKRRDLDNIYSAKKYILDAMQKANILENDNQKWVVWLSDTIEIGDFEGVEVEVMEVD